ncbi:MAG: hypothetical protein WAU00_08070 [Caldilinea sp.]
MKNARMYIVVMAVLALVALAGLSVAMNTAQVQAGPMAAPTPVAAGFSPKAPAEMTWLSDVVVVADAGSAALNVAGWQAVDIQYNIDQTDVNTVTLKLQFSNDGVNWTDGATLVSGNAADASVLNQQTVFGKYARVYSDVTNTSPVTVTAIGILK